MSLISEYKEFWGLIIFGNIENLVIASQGAVKCVDPVILGLLSVIVVIMWLLIGTFGTKVAIKYSRIIEFIGGFAIFVLGIQSMLEALPNIHL